MHFADLLNERGITRGVEIGTDRGLFAVALLERWTCAEILVCVDPWEPYDQMPFDRALDKAVAVAVLTHHPELWGKFRLLQMTGHRAAELMPGMPYHHPGFVYIDGNHDYPCAKADIADWWPQVVSGGILAGHDYTAECDGVRRAVDEFIEAEGLELNTTAEPNESFSWWVSKP